MEFENRLRTELATIFDKKKRFTTIENLKRDYPEFVLWRLLSDAEQKQLLTETFRPQAYARSLTLHRFGLTSPDTLKKDRQKLNSRPR